MSVAPLTFFWSRVPPLPFVVVCCDVSVTAAQLSFVLLDLREPESRAPSLLRQGSCDVSFFLEFWQEPPGGALVPFLRLHIRGLKSRAPQQESITLVCPFIFWPDGAA